MQSIFASGSRPALASTIIVSLLCVCAQSAEPLPGTAPLDWPEEDLSGRMMDGAHRFVEQQIAAAAKNRFRFWKFNASNETAWTDAVQKNRERLGEIIGVSDPPERPRMERYGDDQTQALVAETETYRVFQVRWDVLSDLSAEGLLVEPKQPPAAGAVVVPDTGQTPEQLMGLAPGIPAPQQLARLLAENGCEVLLPVIIARQPLETTDPQIQRSNQTAREWIYRQAYHMGEHVVGYEVTKVLAALTWLRNCAGINTIGLAGYGDGGQLAFYASALSNLADVTLVSGYFGPREETWSEPLDRNVFDLLTRFSDAEIASLILPQQLIVEHSAVPPYKSSKGDLQTPAGTLVRAEFQRIPTPAAFAKPSLVIGPADAPVGPFSVEASRAFARRLNSGRDIKLSEMLPKDLRREFDPSPRQRRALQDMERHVQNLIRSSERIREKFFLYNRRVLPELENQPWSTDKTRPLQNAEKFIAAAKAFREKFQREAMGKFDVEYLPFNPRTRKVVETDQWTAWDVVIDVWPDVFAWGLLVVPKDVQPGEKRPVVVCQHGRNGVPRDCLDKHNTAYNDFAAKLAERGFITFAPHNLYRGEDRYRWLNRKANCLGCTLFSFIIGQHERILDWLGTLPNVDSERIAFYGLSYGGETAVRVPTILEKYCLSICSGDFNQWTTKVASTDEPFSFMRTIEWEMPYWNLGQTFDYAEMAYLTVPRPFMVERGHLDRVGRDQWVAHEYAKVRFLYAQLGLADRTEIEFFQGGHSINGQGTFAFLHKHLRWPTPEERK